MWYRGAAAADAAAVGDCGAAAVGAARAGIVLNAPASHTPEINPPATSVRAISKSRLLHQAVSGLIGSLPRFAAGADRPLCFTGFNAAPASTDRAAGRAAARVRARRRR